MSDVDFGQEVTAQPDVEKEIIELVRDWTAEDEVKDISKRWSFEQYVQTLQKDFPSVPLVRLEEIVRAYGPPPPVSQSSDPDSSKMKPTHLLVKGVRGAAAKITKVDLAVEWLQTLCEKRDPLERDILRLGKEHPCHFSRTTL